MKLDKKCYYDDQTITLSLAIDIYPNIFSTIPNFEMQISL